MRAIWTCFTLIALFLVPTLANSNEIQDLTLEQAVSSPTRDANSVARDASRHPKEELEFFGIKPSMTVVEIWPSKGYWTEILAPYLHNHGTYYIALSPGNVDKELSHLLTDQSVYGNVKITQFFPDKSNLAPPGSVDAILTFRNLHNWLKMGKADLAMKIFYKTLKAGGILGIEDHRGLSDVAQDIQTPNGYVQEQFAIDLAKKAGFKFVASSPLNNNPKDTKQWPKGVWTLPPTLALGDQDRAQYEAIGEADNFVLLFQKPLKTK